MLLKEGGLGGVYRAAAYVAHDVITSPGGQSFSSLARYPKAIFPATSSDLRGFQPWTPP